MLSRKPRSSPAILWVAFPIVFGTGWAGIVHDGDRYIGLSHGRGLDWRGVYRDPTVEWLIVHAFRNGTIQLL